MPPFNVPSDRCVAPTLDYSAVTVPGAERIVFIYSMSPFTSSCSGRVVGYWFCYQNLSSTTGEMVNISAVLLLEDMGTDYTIVRRFTVVAIPGGDCLSGGQCCVSRNLSAENQFGTNSSYHYGVVDLPDGPNMIQTHQSVGRRGYLLTTAEYTQSGDTLRKSGSPTPQPLKMFQFIIGELRVSFADESDNALIFNSESPKIGFPWKNFFQNYLDPPWGSERFVAPIGQPATCKQISSGEGTIKSTHVRLRCCSY